MGTLLEIKEKLKHLESEINVLKLKYNYSNGFDDKKDLQEFISDNKEILEESKRLKEKIKTLEWELMTPEEQARKLEVKRKIIAKTRKTGKS